MLQLVRNLKKDSLRRSHVVRFYIQEKEDPHGFLKIIFFFYQFRGFWFLYFIFPFLWQKRETNRKTFI